MRERGTDKEKGKKGKHKGGAPGNPEVRHERENQHGNRRADPEFSTALVQQQTVREETEQRDAQRNTTSPAF